MYVEISARCTGKTSRLLDAVQSDMRAYKDDNVYFNVVTLNLSLCSVIKQRLRERGINLEKRIKIRPATSLLTINQHNFAALNSQWYFDEFDHYPENVKQHILVDRCNHYYTTTPKFIRNSKHIKRWANNKIDDLLLDVISSNNWKCVQYPVPLTSHEFWEMQSVPKSEVNGTWFDPTHKEDSECETKFESYAVKLPSWTKNNGS